MSVTNKIRLGPHETKLLFDLEARGADLFSLTEAEDILRIERSDAEQVVSRLRKKGRVVEVRKGFFLLVPARAGLKGGWSENTYRIIDSMLEGPYYVAFWSAMNYWGMTEQIPRATHVVIPGRRRPFQFHGQRILFVTLKPGRIFGVAKEPLERGTFSVSDREKTILDGLLLTRYCGGIGEVAKGLSAAQQEIRWTYMAKYLERLKVDAVRRRLGYLLDSLGIDVPLRRRLTRSFKGYRWLDPSAPLRRLAYSEKWGLIVNVDSSELEALGRT